MSARARRVTPANKDYIVRSLNLSPVMSQIGSSVQAAYSCNSTVDIRNTPGDIVSGFSDANR